ncbi:hypothetical protein AB0C04_01630 [Micromonospora sp. NPDC048909]|uniref:hypothetical protein n=1 Tax=Micromonospora sp. NPDC048909 TaxID=3155643 RepID=UPI0033C6209D
MTPSADAPARPPRPVTVTIAFWVQLATVLVLLALVALVIAQAVQWDGQIDRAVRLVPDADPDEVRGERWINITMALILGIPTLVLALWLAATALPLRRGGNTARILVFVAGGAQLLICLAQGCSGAFFVPLIFAGGIEGEPFPEEGYPEETPTGPDADSWQESPFLQALYDSSDPFDAVLFPLAGIGILTVLVLTVALVLLVALPPAHRWFVPRTASPARPVPPAGYPLPAISYPVPPGYPVPGNAVPPGYPVPGYAVPPGYPVPPGYAVPPGYPVPPGYLICPDPAVHLAPAAPPAGPEGPASDRPPAGD